MDIVFYLLLITALLNLILACFLYLKNRKNGVNIGFICMVLGVALWSITNAICLKIKTLQTAIFWSQISYLSAVFIASGFLYFSLVFPPSLRTLKKFGPKKYHKIFLVLSLSLISIIIFIPGFTVKTVILHPWRIITGSGLYLFAAYFLVIMGWAFRNLIRKFFLSQGKERNQLIYVFLGTVLTAIPGIFFNLILPIQGIYQFVSLGPIFAFIMIGFISYAMLKYQLFNIKIISTELLTFSLWIFLFVRLLLSETTQERIVNGALLFLVVIFGILIIKSVMAEIRARGKIEQLAKKLEMANEKLKKLDREKSDFLNIATHQLRTPMTIIKGYISMFKEGMFGQTTKEAKDAMTKVYISNERLIKLINDLLDISRIERGEMKYTFEKQNVESVIKNTVTEFRPVAEDVGLALNYLKPNSKIPEISFDADYIRQVITNLLDNAIKYTKKGEINVSISPTPKNAQIKIQDTGQGLNEKEMNGLFKRYHRGIKEGIKGMGIGLYIAKKVIDDHKGKIWAESEGEGKGSAFFIELPAS